MFWKKSKSKSDSQVLESKEVLEREEVLENQVFARTYGVELFFETLVKEIPVNELLKNLKKRINNVKLVSESPEMLLFSFEDYLVEYTDGKIPAQIAVFLTTEETHFAEEKYRSALYQSWSFPGAKEVIESCKYTIAVTDFLSSGLDHQDRVNLFQSFLFTFVELLDCKAIYWMNSQQFLDPNQYRLNHPDEEDYNILYGPLNVRLANIEGTSGDLIMDTLGLGALGLPDLQCHFKGLESNEVAMILYNYGSYIFNMGDVIEDGNTVAGIGEQDKWECQHEMSLLAPNRMVIDINPGSDFAAGNR